MREEGGTWAEETPVFRLKKTDAWIATEVPEKDEEAEDRAPGRNLLCRVCLSIITSEEEGISMSGSHRHVFVNPSGVVYAVGCFRSAPGCLRTGTPTLEYTWFAGYLWSYALCARCGLHLGWYYESGGGGFFGLITDHLIREEKRD